MIFIARDWYHPTIKWGKSSIVVFHFGYHIRLNAILAQYQRYAPSSSAFVQDKSPYFLVKAAAQHMWLNPKYLFQLLSIMQCIQGKMRVIHIHHFFGISQFIVPCKYILESLIGESAIEKLYLYIHNPFP